MNANCHPKIACTQTDKLQCWSDARLMKFNPRKSKVMMMGHSERRTKYEISRKNLCVRGT